ncbi:hypothetical protein HPT25_19550 [Bacillus sp. BRMEA1]|nr:hypothetical protein [Neobacillus endophyticus]NRD79559.1 hypothetical protein [Neobacillus endophyticus]
MSRRDKQPSAQKAKRLLEQLGKLSNNQQPQQMQLKQPPKKNNSSK